MSEKPKFSAKKSYKDGHVAVFTSLKSRGWHTGDATIRLDGKADITTLEARELAKGLISLADKADEKVAAKAKHEENRRKYREREIAAGRMVIIGRL